MFGEALCSRLSLEAGQRWIMPAFTVSFSFLDPQSRKGIYFKQDGQRFGSDRTLKFCTDVKYEIRVTVKPSVARLR